VRQDGGPRHLLPPGRSKPASSGCGSVPHWGWFYQDSSSGDCLTGRALAGGGGEGVLSTTVALLGTAHCCSFGAVWPGNQPQRLEEGCPRLVWGRPCGDRSRCRPKAHALETTYPSISEASSAQTAESGRYQRSSGWENRSRGRFPANRDRLRSLPPLGRRGSGRPDWKGATGETGRGAGALVPIGHLSRAPGAENNEDRSSDYHDNHDARQADETAQISVPASLGLLDG
jgi:hypothetical protein